MTLPLGTSSAAKSDVMPCPEVVVGLSLGDARPQRQDRLRPVERVDLGLLIGAETRARRGGFRQSPTMSRTFSMNCGLGVDPAFVDTLKLGGQEHREGGPPHADDREP